MCFFDITEAKVGVKDFFAASRQRFPDGVGLGIKIHRGDRVLVEIILVSKEAMEDACSTGVQVGDKLLKAHAALEPDSIILIMKLENIPIIHHGEIIKGLEESLAPFGKMLDVRLLELPHGGWFMGKVYVCLELHKTEDHATNELTDRIPWHDDDKCTLYATWKAMAPYCTYCHQEGHGRRDCPAYQNQTQSLPRLGFHSVLVLVLLSISTISYLNYTLHFKQSEQKVNLCQLPVSKTDGITQFGN